MRVSNYINKNIQEVFNGGAKAQASNSYLVSIIWLNEKHVYLVKREGQRSWGAYALTDIQDDMTHIKGNSANVLSNVLSNHSGGDVRPWKIWKVSNVAKADLRKAIMEVICYGTIEEVSFTIEKA